MVIKLSADLSYTYKTLTAGLAAKVGHCFSWSRTSRGQSAPATRPLQATAGPTGK